MVPKSRTHTIIKLTTLHNNNVITEPNLNVNGGIKLELLLYVITRRTYPNKSLRIESRDMVDPQTCGRHRSKTIADVSRPL